MDYILFPALRLVSWLINIGVSLPATRWRRLDGVLVGIFVDGIASIFFVVQHEVVCLHIRSISARRRARVLGAASARRSGGGASQLPWSRAPVSSAIADSRAHAPGVEDERVRRGRERGPAGARRGTRSSEKKGSGGDRGAAATAGCVVNRRQCGERPRVMEVSTWN